MNIIFLNNYFCSSVSFSSNQMKKASGSFEGVMLICTLFSQIGLQHYCFLVFFVVCSSVAVYILMAVPETKNKSFVEIQHEFQLSNKKKAAGTDEAEALLISSSF